MIEYTLDEPREQMIRNSASAATLTTALEYASPPVKRHYAIPGSQRCIQCHMGSPGMDFVLGFLPLQIARRATGAGGSYEPTGDDELTQLQRFIDYGIISGITAPGDVLPLEQAEGTRTARNDYELQAQAYMVGNCAHCHNPRGYPSVRQPALKDALNFLATPTGGVFQFPLDKASPLRSRGINTDVAIPYITPSLREYPVGTQTTDTWTTKWTATCSDSADDPVVNFLCKGRKDAAPAHLSAPWRSLVYRNVDTPFMYADDFVVFPHMPMNTPGYDCRLAPIMGDWMVSIPSVRKNPEIDEDAVPDGTAHAVDTNPQPYVEVLPTDPAYEQASMDAQKRLDDYHSSGRYSFCPDTADIVDPAVVAAGGGPPIVPASGTEYNPKDKSMVLQPDMGVPLHAHWVVTDLTNPPGDWYPRRPDWETIIVRDMVDMSNLPTDAQLAMRELQARQTVLDQVRSVSLTQQLRDFTLTEIPYGLWQQNPGCDFSSVPKASDIAPADRPRWMAASPPDPNAPVYMQSPAVGIFNNICYNCHGPKADAQGVLADAIQTMTGGTARVADFRDGLFGPLPTPGANRERVFGPDGAAIGLTANDMGARYMSWMALGGTQAQIPPALLNIVSATRILGVARNGQHLSTSGSPNMLKLAQALCAQVLGATPDVDQPALDDFFFEHGTLNWTDSTALIDSNADAETWQKLCSLGNRPIVRVPTVSNWATLTSPKIVANTSLYWGDTYPAGAPVLDSHGHVASGIAADDTYPICFQKPADATALAQATSFLNAHPVGGPGGAIIPFCPDDWMKNPANKLATAYDDESGQIIYTDADTWAVRGAINAGMSVFLYLDQLEQGQVAPKPLFNHCEQLAPAASP